MEKLSRAFKTMDIDQDGFISRQDLRLFLEVVGEVRSPE
jgi:Ca2+-binding EF-hand superfamily protein